MLSKSLAALGGVATLFAGTAGTAPPFPAADGTFMPGPPAVSAGFGTGAGGGGVVSGSVAGLGRGSANSERNKALSVAATSKRNGGGPTTVRYGPLANPSRTARMATTVARKIIFWRYAVNFFFITIKIFPGGRQPLFDCKTLPM